MIYTFTPNPALDITWSVPEWQRNASIRVDDIREMPGGKGLNVARVADQLGARVAAVAPLGGDAGKHIAAHMAVLAPRVTQHWVPSPVPTRRSVAVVDSDVTIFNEAGTAPPLDVWDQAAQWLRAHVQPGDVLAVCGSLPGGTTLAYLDEIFAAARGAGAHLIVDTSGAGLVEAASIADVLKPNEHELRAATKCHSLVDGAHQLLDRGARWVFVSRGSEGMNLYTRDGTWHAASVPVQGGNPTGCGDASVAAIATHVDGTTQLTEDIATHALADAVATGAAAVAYPTAGGIDTTVRDQTLACVVPTRAGSLISKT